MAAWLIVKVEEGVGVLLSVDKEETRKRQGETEGAYNILSLIILMPVNKQALFFCIHKEDQHLAAIGN